MNGQLPARPRRGAFPDWFSRSNNRRILVGIFAMTMIALTVSLWTTRATNPIRGDTYEYLFFDPSRTVGYPAFLWLVRLATGHVAMAVQAQMVLLAGSLLLLGWSAHFLVRRPIFAYVLQALLVGQIAIWKASAYLMTEAVSTTLVAIWCAQLLRLIRQFSIARAGLLIVVCGLGTMVRPSLVALFLGSAVFFAVAGPRPERGRLIALAALGLVVSWCATPAAQLLVHGSAQTTSPFARGVLQHTLFCDQPHIARDADSAAVEHAASKVRRYIAIAPADVQEQLRRAYSTPLRFGLIIPVLGRRHNLQSRSQVDPYLERIAVERVEGNPLCYGESVIGAYSRMATFDTNRTKEDERRIRKFTQVNPLIELPQYPVLARDDQRLRQTALEVHNRVSGLNPERMDLKLDGKISNLTVLPVRLFYGTAAIIGFLAVIGLAISRGDPPDVRNMKAALAAAGLSFHLCLGITAIVELGLSRYVLPLWPIACVIVALAVFRLVEKQSGSRDLPIALEGGPEPAFA